MDISAWIALVSVTLTGLGFVLGLFKYFTKRIDDTRKELGGDLKKAIETGDDKRARIYERVDEIKKNHKDDTEVLRKEIMEDFVNCKVFGLVTGNTERMIEDLKKSIDEINRKLDKLIAK